jgi:hypothetical protein
VKLALRPFGAELFAHQPVGQMFVLIGDVDQLPAPLFIGFRLCRIAHLRCEDAIVLCAGEIVLHRFEPSNAMEQHENQDNDENGTKAADAMVTVPIAVTSEAATEPSCQKNHDDDEKDQSEGHRRAFHWSAQYDGTPLAAPQRSDMIAVSRPGTGLVRRTLERMLFFRGMYALAPLVAHRGTDSDHHHSVAYHWSRLSACGGLFSGDCT